MNKDLEYLNYWLIFTDNSEIIHCCGFLEYPNKNDIDCVIYELKEDPDFNFSNEFVDNLSYKVYGKNEGLKLVNEFMNS